MREKRPLLGLLFDENYQALGHDAVMSHGRGRAVALHGGHHGIHVRNIHEDRHLGRVLWVDKRSDVGHSKRTKKLLTLR